MVDNIKKLKAEGRNTDIQEEHVNHILYKLYNLSYAEAIIVDGELSISEAEYNTIKI